MKTAVEDILTRLQETILSQEEADIIINSVEARVTKWHEVRRG